MTDSCLGVWLKKKTMQGLSLLEVRNLWFCFVGVAKPVLAVPLPQLHVTLADGSREMRVAGNAHTLTAAELLRSALHTD